MNEYTFSDLRCHYQTGRSYVVSGEGRNRVYGYRTGVQCNLGDIEQKEWCEIVKELIHRKGEQELYKFVYEHANVVMAPVGIEIKVIVKVIIIS